MATRPLVLLPLLDLANFRRRYQQLLAAAQLQPNWASLFFVLSDMLNLAVEACAGSLCYSLARPTNNDLAWFAAQGFYVAAWPDGSFAIVLK